MSEVQVSVPWPFDPLAIPVAGIPTKGDPHEVTFNGSTISEQRDDTLIRVTSTTYPSLSWWVSFAEIELESVAALREADAEQESAPLDFGVDQEYEEALMNPEPQVTEPEKTEATE